MSNDHTIINLTPVNTTPVATAPVIEATAIPVADESRMGWIQRRNDTRLTNFDELIPYLRDRTSHARASTIPSKAVQVMAHPNPQTMDQLNELAVVVDGVPLDFTHHAFGQIAQLGKAPPAFLRTLPGSLVADTLDYSLKYNREVEDVKLYHDEHQLRAATGPNYGRVADVAIAEALSTVLDTGRWEPAQKHMGLSVTDRSLNMFLIDVQNPVEVGSTMNGDPDVIHRGLRIVNSEVGAAALKLEAFTFRGYCLNGMIFGMQGANAVNIRHTSGAPARWAREIQPAIARYAGQDGMTLVDAVNKAKETVVARDNEQALEWLRKRKLTGAQARHAIERIQTEENAHPRTLWHMAQGVTAIARDIPHADDRVELERIGGRIFQMAA